jgi:hypothetical protein
MGFSMEEAGLCGKMIKIWCFSMEEVGLIPRKSDKYGVFSMEEAGLCGKR